MGAPEAEGSQERGLQPDLQSQGGLQPQTQPLLGPASHKDFSPMSNLNLTATPPKLCKQVTD